MVNGSDLSARWLVPALVAFASAARADAASQSTSKLNEIGAAPVAGLGQRPVVSRRLKNGVRFAILSRGPTPSMPTYTVRLDVAKPDYVIFSMRVPFEQVTLSTPVISGPMSAGPVCGHIALSAMASRTWIKPSGCEAVSWAGRIPNLDERSFDASRPKSFWNSRRQLWLLTGDLPWLRFEGQPRAPIHVFARGKSDLVETDASLPKTWDSPIYILSGRPKRRYDAGPVTIALYGDIPIRPQGQRLQRAVAATLRRWRRDLLPDDAAKLRSFNYLWLAERKNREPGLFASTGSDAILMQFIPDPNDRYPFAKLDAGILLTGAHEGFHALAGALSSGKPTWVNESWASFFAYATARHVLTGPALATARNLFDEPASVSVLHAQSLLNTGDGSRYDVFYTKAGRFWAAIERVLTNRSNGSGRLAALLKQTRGMQGVNWNDPASIAAFLDPLTAGRSREIVQCYLVEDNCQESRLSGS